MYQTHAIMHVHQHPTHTLEILILVDVFYTAHKANMQTKITTDSANQNVQAMLIPTDRILQICVLEHALLDILTLELNNALAHAHLDSMGIIGSAMKSVPELVPLCLPTIKRISV